MASKSKRNRQRRKRKEALLAAPDVAITVAVKEKKMGGGIMVPPEREAYAAGALVQLLKKILKPLSSDQRATRPMTRKQAAYAQDMTGAVVVAGGLGYAANSDQGQTIIEAADAGEIDVEIKNPDERINPDDFPTYEKGTDSAVAFQDAFRQAREARADTFEFEGRTYTADLPVNREEMAEGGKFPDLTGDGKVTQADILKGRDVFQEGGKAEESPLQLFDQMGKQGDNINWDRWTTLTSEDPTGPIDPASKKGLQLIQKLDRQRREYGDRTFTEAFTDAMFKKYPRGTKPLLAFLGDVKARRRFTKENPNLVETINSLKEQREKILESKERTNKQAGGSMMVAPEMEATDTPVDTYPNIPPEEMAAAEASQLPDQQMEDEFIDYVLNEALQPEEQTYLMNALEGDPQLSMIFDKVVGTASEFTGSGEVEGPGTGVSDSIPARLSDGEFVMTRKATDQIGADRLQTMMDEAERAYDGGLMRKDEDTDIEDNMNKVMMSSNQMPSLNIRQR